MGLHPSTGMTPSRYDGWVSIVKHYTLAIASQTPFQTVRQERRDSSREEQSIRLIQRRVGLVADGRIAEI